MEIGRVPPFLPSGMTLITITTTIFLIHPCPSIIPSVDDDGRPKWRRITFGGIHV